jgi:post-segregation antitoxin (ccd killing protein)
MSKKHYFKINEDFASRSMARLYGLKEEKPGIWFVIEHTVSSSEQRSNLRSAERAFSKIKITEAQGVAEGGPFSYGAKKPRKGSVAYNAEVRRKEQEKSRQPIEPKDQMVGTAKVTKGVTEALPPVAAAAAAVARQQAVAKGAAQAVGGATAGNAFMSVADRVGAGQSGETNLSNIQAPESLEQGNAPKKLKKDGRGAKFRKQSKQQSVAEGDNSNLTKVMIPKVGQRVIADVSGYGRFGLYGTEPGVIVRISSPRLIKVRIDKDGEIYDFDNNELYQQGLTDSKLNELDLFAPRITYIKIHNGQWVKAKYRATQTLGTEGDNPTFVDFSYVSDDAANRMGLNQRLKAGTTGRRPAGKITIANPGPTQQTGPFGPTNIDLIDLSNPYFNADEKLLSQLNQWLEKTPSLNKNKGVAESSDKIFTVVYYSKKTDRNVTKQIKASSESELWDRLRAKGIDVVSVKEQGVAEGLTKQAKARKEAEAVMAVIKRLEAELKDPNPHLNKADIQRRLDNEKRRLELYRDVLDEQGVAEGSVTKQYVAAEFIDEFGDGDHWYVKGTPDLIQKFVMLANSIEQASMTGSEYDPKTGSMGQKHSQLGDADAPQWTQVPATNLDDIKPINSGVINALARVNLKDAGDEWMSDFLWSLEEKGLAKIGEDWDQQDVNEGQITKTKTGIIHRATDKYGAGEEPFNPRNPGKYARDINYLDKNTTSRLDKGMGIKHSHGNKKSQISLELDEEQTKFAGEKVGQKPGDQVRGTERAKSSKKQHPFKGRLVGDGA